MNAGSDDRFTVPTWAWVSLTAAALMLIGAIWWASSAPVSGSDQFDVAQVTTAPYRDNIGPQAGAGPAQPYVAPAPDYSAYAPGVSTDSTASSGAKVTVTPVQPNPVRKAPVKPAVGRAEDNSVRDMFPVGRIIDRSEAVPEPVAMAARPAAESESFPDFTYAGKLWRFSGKYVSSDEIDLVPTGYTVSGIEIYALANTAAPNRVLFMPSSQDSCRLAVYR